MDISGLWRKTPEEDSPEFAVLPWQAQALLSLLWRKVDRKTGAIKLGSMGLQGVCSKVGTLRDWPEIEPVLRLLLDAGQLVHDEQAKALVIPHYAESQAAHAHTKDAERMRTSRTNAHERVRTRANEPEPARTDSPDLDLDRDKDVEEEKEGEPPGARVPSAIWDPSRKPTGDRGLTELHDAWPEFKTRAFVALGIDTKAAGQLEIAGTLLPKVAHALLIERWAEQYAAGADAADLLVLADWIAAGAFESIRSDRPGWLVRSLGQHMSDARLWDEQGRPELRRRGSPPAAGRASGLVDERNAKDEAERRRAATQRLLGGEP